MGNMREIRDRIKSINDIMKITNAMYLISSSKLKKAKKDLAATQPYFNKLLYAMRSILSRAPEDIDMRYFAQLVSMAEAADADEEVLAEGMQAEHEHEHEHDHHDDESDSHEEPPELDEHVWLSLRRAALACTAMKEALCKADPAHEDIYNQNCTDYLQKLQELDSDFTKMTSQAARDIIVVADRFPFRYLAEDYGLTYYAAFPGCSAETEASFETIVFLSEKVESLHLPCVLVTEGSNSSLAKTILENAGSDGKILTLQSLQAVSQKEIDTGVTYLSKMQENYDVLKQALNS